MSDIDEPDALRELRRELRELLSAQQEAEATVELDELALLARTLQDLRVDSEPLDKEMAWDKIVSELDRR